MKSLSLEAATDNLEKVLAFIDEDLEKYGCPMKAQVQINLAVEEIYVNIAHYAYAPEVGMVTVQTEITPEPVTITVVFSDSGKPYNPLEKEDPDVTLSAEEREIGGLGIFLTKKVMDEVTYEYKDGMNILTMKKAI